MRVQYQGPVDRVCVPVPGSRQEIEVARGDIVEVPDELGASLIQQDIWTKRPAAKRPPAPAADEAKEED